MLWQLVAKIMGYFLYGIAAVLLIPCAIAAYYQFYADPSLHPQPHSTLAFAESIAVCLAAGVLLRMSGRNAAGDLYRREAIVLVVLIWFLFPAFGALPFTFSGTLKNPVQAYFEIVSGLTTTGSTVLSAKQYNEEGREIPIVRVIPGIHDKVYTFYGTVDPVRNPETGQVVAEGIEAVGKALLFWRSFTQWLGGGGIIVLFVAVLPALGVGGKMLFQTEVPGPIKDSLTPRIKETASHLWKIYLGISALEVLALLVLTDKVDFFQALTTTFATVSTGGLTVFNESIGSLDSAAVDWILIVFMFLGSVNFTLYFYLIRGKIFRLYDIELLIFISIIVSACAFVSWYIVGTEKMLLTGQSGIYSMADAIRYASFQIVSIISTTGFSTTNYDIWPYAPQAIMLLLMFFGGMAGSTSGGIKTIRLYMLFRLAQYQVESIFRPETVRQFRLGDHEVDMTATARTMCFFLLLVAISTLGTILYTIDGIDLETAISLSALHVNNVGMGFRMAGPMETCAFLSDFGLCLSSVLMIAGRLEFLAVLAILVPAFWKRYS